MQGVASIIPGQDDLVDEGVNSKSFMYMYNKQHTNLNTIAQ